MNDRRFALAERAVWIGIVGNLLLAVVKGFIGLASGSKALLADAANSATVVAASVAVLVGLRSARKPLDQGHSFSHGKAGSISAIVVSIILMVVGVEIGLSAVRSIAAGSLEAPAWYAIVVIVGAIIVKELLFRYTLLIGTRLSSQSVLATAWDHRTDVYASLAAFVGIAGAVLGGYLNVGILLYLDPAAGILISILVLRMGYRIIIDTSQAAADNVILEEDAKDLVQTVQAVKGVISINDLRAREQGHYVVVDVKISVNPRLTVLEGHDIGKAVKSELMKSYSHVSDVFIHINPYDPGYPYKTNHHPEIDDYPNLVH